MKKEIAKKWIKALKSGKYKQGKSFLKQYDTKNQPRHCCLGVLCELYNESMKKNHKKTLTVKNSNICPENGYRYVTFSGAGESLPPVVKKWAGMKSNYGDIDNQFYDSLADMNDFGKTFNTISNTIEKNIENL
jgi:hypothetical protein